MIIEMRNNPGEDSESESDREEEHRPPRRREAAPAEVV